MDNGWKNLRESDSSDNRVQAQAEWAKRREEHFENPNPGILSKIYRAMGNMVSNHGLEKAERADLSWEHSPEDMEKGGYISNSPIDNKRFDVYERMLRAHQMGQTPDAATKSQWLQIKAGKIPE